MITFNVEQGTPEWHLARAGKITASMFAEVRKKLKSGPRKGMCSAKAEDYALNLALERETGRVVEDDQFETWAMRRGKDLEGDARLLHEQRRGTMIEQVGFACDDSERFGASADGLIDDDGGAEYKCFTAPSKLRPILEDSSLESVIDQVQGSMWITGRQWWDFVLYCPQVAPRYNPMKIITVERDDAYIKALEADLLEFDALVESLRGRLDEWLEPGEAAPAVRFGSVPGRSAEAAEVQF